MRVNVITKVRKLLLLASSMNEHEAANAQAAADALIERYQIKKIELKTEKQVKQVLDKQMGAWRTQLAFAVAQSGACAVLLEKRGMVLCGPKSEVARARGRYMDAVIAVNHLCTFRMPRLIMRTPKLVQIWFDVSRLAAAMAITKRLLEPNAKPVAGRPSAAAPTMHPVLTQTVAQFRALKGSLMEELQAEGVPPLLAAEQIERFQFDAREVGERVGGQIPVAVVRGYLTALSIWTYWEREFARRAARTRARYYARRRLRRRALWILVSCKQLGSRKRLMKESSWERTRFDGLELD